MAKKLLVHSFIHYVITTEVFQRNVIIEFEDSAHLIDGSTHGHLSKEISFDTIYL